MKITNTQVFGLEGSIISSRYPMMMETPSEEGFMELDEGLQTIIMNDRSFEELYEIFDNDFEDEQVFMDRASKLGRARQGTGHNNFLKGIIVQADVTASQNWWLQWGRYNFADIVSSQSKMHRIMKMDLDSQCNKWVDTLQIQNLEKHIEVFNNFNDYKKEGVKYTKLRNGERIDFTKDNLFQLVVNNIPMGLELTARITDNYLSIKTQYEQRVKVKHKLYEWSDWGMWAEGLPYFTELTGINTKGDVK